MPCRGLRDNIDDFEDCLSQLQEIVTKYSNTHSIVLGGDFNEDLSIVNNPRRKTSLEQFLTDNQQERHTQPLTEQTSAQVKKAISSLNKGKAPDQNLVDNVLKIETLTDEHTNVSDHYPLCCTLECVVNRHVTVKPEVAIAPAPPPHKRVRWDKLDKEEYKQTVSSGTSKLRHDISSPSILDLQITKLNEIVVKAARSQGPQQQQRQRKAKLVTWTPEIKQAVRNKKKAFYEWKKTNRPDNPQNTWLINIKLTASYLRKLCRIDR